MDLDDYRRLQQRIHLTTTGHVPDGPVRLTRQEQDAVLDRIDNTWQLVHELERADSRRRGAYDRATATETWIAFKRWFLSHHLFIPQLSITAHCLAHAVDAAAEGQREDVRRWVRLASEIRYCCGALFVYGVDFRPCNDIYGPSIRTLMPPGFSGFWIKERQLSLQPALAKFCGRFPKHGPDETPSALRAEWTRADERYHELHVQVMHDAVSNGKSLAHEYRDKYGKAHPVTEQEFDQYDAWFAIERSPDLDRLHYIFQVCDVIERVVGDLMGGHRLDAVVTKELVDGLKATIAVFGDWVGPVPESSPFYPKSLRGE